MEQRCMPHDTAHPPVPHQRQYTDMYRGGTFAECPCRYSAHRVHIVRSPSVWVVRSHWKCTSKPGSPSEDTSGAPLLVPFPVKTPATLHDSIGGINTRSTLGGGGSRQCVCVGLDRVSKGHHQRGGRPRDVKPRLRLVW